MINHGIFPAAPGTFIVTADFTVSPPVAYHTPVVGWQHVQNNLCFPMTAIPFAGMQHGSAILHGGEGQGWISDPTHKLCFTNLEEWINFIRTAKPKATPKTGEELSTQKQPETAADEDEGETATETPPEPTKPAAPRSAPKPAATGIEWGKKAYTGKSFWQCERGIFVLEGGVPYPKSGATKVTRDEHAAAKRAGAQVIDPHASPASESAAAEDEDDGMDLV